RDNPRTCPSTRFNRLATEALISVLMTDIYPHRVYDASPPEIAKCQKIAAANRTTAHNRQALSVVTTTTSQLRLPPNPAAAVADMTTRITPDIITMRRTTMPA
ncbi:MAG TPA: hypothetical protein VGM35_06165, partial [Xanthobacteraceae bacterium]